MSHVAALTDDTTTVSFTSTNYQLVAMTPVPPIRLLSRASGYPSTNGQRTTASALDDSTVDITLLIVGDDADDLDERLQVLVRLLEQAQRWEEQRVGAPVRLQFARQGVSNPSYRVVTGVPTFPTPQDEEGVGWLDASSIMNETTVQFTLTLEPLAHASTSTPLINETIDMTPGNTDFDVPAMTGDMASPLSIRVTRTNSGNVWNDAWLAVCPMATAVVNFTGTSDSDASGGSAQYVEIDAPGDEILSFAATSPSGEAARYPRRVVIRVKMTYTGVGWAGGNPGDLRFRLRYSTGSAAGNGENPYAGLAYTSWVPYTLDTPAEVNIWRLMDLGTVPAQWQDFDASYTGAIAPEIEVQAMTLRYGVEFLLDTIEVIPYLSFVKLTDLDVGENESVVYDAIAKSGSFNWPRQIPVAYVLDDAFARKMRATRYGTLKPIVPQEPVYIWVQGYNADLHRITDAAEVFVDGLSMYALGLRGGV